MINKTETRGRKLKRVDADRFLELVNYYHEKKDAQVPPPEKK